MKRIQLRSKDISKEIEQYDIVISKKDQAELVEDKYKIILINKKPAFFYYEGKPVPTLKFLQENNVLKKITVDMGAVKFVVNGADVMRPGIVEIEAGIAKDEFVTVIDKNNHKPLAVGIALYSSAEMQAMTSGKVIKNIHYVGDELWRMEV
ncbi:MAG TPA: RNA-binding protein [Candidatus Nanoarchaeia archaeon]|nr:RNA-binding protein [Candidatus Nanoarchaeia archaeon]